MDRPATAAKTTATKNTATKTTATKAIMRLALGGLSAVCVFPLTFSSNTSGSGFGEKAAIAQSLGSDAGKDSTSLETPLALVRSQLTNLEQFPLLPTDTSTLDAASNQLSSTQLSEPSFSWIRDQLGDRYSSQVLIEQWSAYTAPNSLSYVDVVVDEDTWEQLSYFKRYGFLVQFGTAAQDNRHQLRLFHSGDVINRLDELAVQNSTISAVAGSSVRLRGAYFCDRPLDGLFPEERLRQRDRHMAPTSPVPVLNQACGAFLSTFGL